MDAFLLILYNFLYFSVGTNSFDLFQFKKKLFFEEYLTELNALLFCQLLVKNIILFTFFTKIICFGIMKPTITFYTLPRRSEIFSSNFITINTIINISKIIIINNNLSKYSSVFFCFTRNAVNHDVINMMYMYYLFSILFQ